MISVKSDCYHVVYNDIKYNNLTNPATEVQRYRLFHKLVDDLTSLLQDNKFQAKKRNRTVEAQVKLILSSVIYALSTTVDFTEAVDDGLFFSISSLEEQDMDKYLFDRINDTMIIPKNAKNIIDSFDLTGRIKTIIESIDPESAII